MFTGSNHRKFDQEITAYKMVEVFKTNIETGEQAALLAQLIHENFPHYTVNFDLDDCDRILRVKSAGSIHENTLISIIRQQGFEGEILTDEIPPFINREIILSSN